MSEFERRLLSLELRNNLSVFIHRTFQTLCPGQRYHHNWHIDAIACALQQCAERKIKRLLITIPPRHLKSISASVAFPAWLLGRDPTVRIVTVSYSYDLAMKHAQDCRAVMQSAWYRRHFPGTRICRDKNREYDFVTTRLGYRLSTSVGGTLTGRGGNIIILDDALKPEDAVSAVKREGLNEWYGRTLISRLDDKVEDVVVVIMQRLHMEDLAGYLLQSGEQWHHLCLPAIAEEDARIQIGADEYHVRRVGDLLHAEREPLEVLNRQKAAMGTFNFSAQYQQCPLPPEGALVRWEWFRRNDQEPAREAGDSVVQSWDTGLTAGENSDYSACTTWLVKNEHYHLIHVLRERLNFPDLKRCVVSHARQFAAEDVLVENKGSGISLIQELYDDESIKFNVIKYDPELDKLTRMHAQSACIEGGRVYLPREADWLEEFRKELLQFPHGRHDDQVDSMSQFLDWVETRRRRFVGVIGWL